MAISSYFSQETKDAILTRLLSGVADDLDKRQGSVVFDMLSPASLELAQAYLALDQVLTFGFATEDTPRQYLELRCAELGISPKVALKAVGSLTFSGQDGVVVPVGTRVSTDEAEPVYFVTTQAGTITGGAVMVAAEAETAGANGNVAQGTITLVLSDLSGVTAVTNSATFDGGADVETDESLLARYLEKAQKPATSGNAYHYEQWAKEVAGVGDAKVYPLHAGPGTVKVVLLDDEKTTPAQTIVDAVQNYLDPAQDGTGQGVAPIGATVTVVGAQELPINVSATLTLASGADIGEVTAQFSEALTEYLKSIAFATSVATGQPELIRYTQIANLLLGVPPIIDYANLTVNGGTANIQPTSDEVGVVGSVTLS